MRPPAAGLRPPSARADVQEVTADARTGAGRRRRLLLGAALLLLAVAGVVAAAIGTGMRLFVVESPSMGRAAPIGTLVIGAPVSPGAPLRIGTVVTYQPPGAGMSTYTHRIVQVVAGGYRTRGDINGADDPWLVRPSMIDTRAVALLPGVGWIFRAAPLLSCGSAAVWVLSRLVRDPARRSSTRVLGFSLVLSAAFWVYRPLVSYLLLTARATHDGMRATVVATGLLPIRVQATGGRAVDLLSGQVGQLALPGDRHGHVGLTAAPDLDPLGWCVLAGLCLLPTLWTLLRGVPVLLDEEAAADA